MKYRPPLYFGVVVVEKGAFGSLFTVSQSELVQKKQNKKVKTKKKPSGKNKSTKKT